MRQTMNDARRLGLAALLGVGLFAAPAAFAINTSQCDSVSDPMQRAQCRCSASQQTYAEQTSAIIPQLADSNPYLQQVKNAQPGDNASLGIAGVTQSCNGMTKGAFDSALGSLGNFLGFDVSGVLGPIANAAESTVCQSINNAIMQRTTIACPRVSIPGFPMNCSGSLSLNSNGAQIGGSGSFGGTSFGGSGSAGLSGTTAGGGSYNLGPGNTGSGSISQPISTIAQPTSGPTTAPVTGIVGNVTCWITGNC